jgi:multisubunit Na+/H+ antiporter MnhE subunit
VARLIETLLWWSVLFGLWLLTLSILTPAEILAGAVVALPCAAVAPVARHAVGASWRPRLRWLRWLVPLPAAVIADTGRLGAVLLRRRRADGRERGRARELRLPKQADPRLAETQRALAALVLSLAPGSFVIDPVGDQLRVHVLVSGAPRLEKVVGR